MNNNNPSTEGTLRKELAALGAREFEIVALTMEPERGLAALRYALSRGVDYPIPYATKMFDNPDWHPSGEKKRQATNVSVETSCPHCGGDRFILVDDSPDLYGETYSPCAHCNAASDTTRYVANERRVTAPR